MSKNLFKLFNLEVFVHGSSLNGDVCWGPHFERLFRSAWSLLEQIPLVKNAFVHFDFWVVL